MNTSLCFSHQIKYNTSDVLERVAMFGKLKSSESGNALLIGIIAVVVVLIIVILAVVLLVMVLSDDDEQSSSADDKDSSSDTNSDTNVDAETEKTDDSNQVGDKENETDESGSEETGQAEDDGSQVGNEDGSNDSRPASGSKLAQDFLQLAKEASPSDRHYYEDSDFCDHKYISVLQDEYGLGSDGSFFINIDNLDLDQATKDQISGAISGCKHVAHEIRYREKYPENNPVNKAALQEDCEDIYDREGGRSISQSYYDGALEGCSEVVDDMLFLHPALQNL